MERIRMSTIRGNEVFVPLGDVARLERQGWTKVSTGYVAQDIVNNGRLSLASYNVSTRDKERAISRTAFEYLNNN